MFRRSIATAVAIALASLVRCAAAVELPERDWHYVELDDDHVEIYLEDQSREYCAIPADTAGDLIVPEFLGGRKVVSIGKNAFYDCSQLTSVQLPSGVTNISAQAFYGCSSLTNVVFPSGLRSVGALAFSRCGSLQQLDFTCANLSIGERAFINADNLKGLQFDCEGLALGKRAFFGCGGLRFVAISARQLKVGQEAFYGGYEYVLENSEGWTYCGYCDDLRDLTVDCRMLEIGESSFASCSSLTNVILCADISSLIGKSAFYSCTSLKTASLPDALTIVETNAFKSCTSLVSVSFSTNVTTVAYRAFDTCTSLSSVTFGGKEVSVEAQAFYGCEALRSLDFPVSLESVGSRAFEYCESLTNVAFAVAGSNDVRKTVRIDTQAFNRCGSLARVLLPTDMSEIGPSAFLMCESLEDVRMPTNLTVIAERSFEGCAKLVRIEFPENLQSIGRSAFYSCGSLTGFLIPTNQVVDLGAKAFYATRYWNEWPDDSLVVNNGYILGFKGNPTSVELPGTCKVIPEGMFEGMTGLREVIIPPSVTTVGARAFAGSGVCSLNMTNVTVLGVSVCDGCPALTNVALSAELTTIPATAFRMCVSLTGIDIPAAVTTIGEYAFYGCSALTNVTGGAGIRTVNDYSFADCIVLRPFSFPEGTSYGVHVFQNVQWTEMVLVPAVGTMQDEYPLSFANIRSVVFPAGVASVVDRCFFGCASLEAVNLPSTVTSLGDRAYSGCAAVTSVVMSAAILSVGENAFEGCASVSNVMLSGHHAAAYLFPDRYAEISRYTIDPAATVICSNMLAGCSRLTSFALPTNLVSLQARAFSGCSSLTSVLMPCTLTDVGTNAFVGCTSVTNVTLSGFHSVKYLFPDTYDHLRSIWLQSAAQTICAGMLEGCSSITAFVIPVGVTKIGDRAFAGCTGLTDAITLPETVTSVGNEAFEGCTGLKTVRFLGDKPTSVGTNIYKHTSGSLITGVLEEHATSWASGGKLPPYWPVGDAYRRPTGWWVGVQWAVVRYDTDVDKTSYVRLLADGLHSVKESDLSGSGSETVQHDGYWYLSPAGGDPVEFPLFVTESMRLYRHWNLTADEDDEDDDGEDDVQPAYDFSSAGYFCGFLMDGESLVGTLKVTVAKGKLNRKTGEMEAAVTAVAQLLGEGSVSLKGTLKSDLKATLCSTRGGDRREMKLEITETDAVLGLEGDFNGWVIAASQDVFSGKTALDKSLASSSKTSYGTYAAAFSVKGGPLVADGCCFGVSAKVASKGKVTVAGVLPDATKLSASAQMIWMDGRYVVPVVASAYTSKRGGFGFLLCFEENSVSVESCSPWVRAGEIESEGEVTPIDVGLASKLDSRVSYIVVSDSSFDISGVNVQTDLVPDNVCPFTATASGWRLPKADSLKYIKDEGVWEVSRDNGNCVGLKLSYKAASGVFSGSYYVYGATEAEKSYKQSVTVNGVMVNGVGYGHAYLKKVGSVPLSIEMQ